MSSCATVASWKSRILAIGLVLQLNGQSVPASDWPAYRGPNHDGVSTETIRTNWTEIPPRQLWKVPLGSALSSFTIAGPALLTQVRRSISSGDQELCVALDAATGQELWATPLGVADYPNGGVGSDDGPRSTPTLDGTRVYVLTSYLRMVCLDAGTGATIWSKDLVAEYGSQVIAWQNAASPLIVDDLIFMNANAPGGRLLALQKQDGSLAWRRQEDEMTQSSPVFATVAGTRQVIFFAQSGLVSVVPETGELLWRYALLYSTSTAMSPVVAGDVVYASAAYGVGAGAVRITAQGNALTASEIWRTPGANMNHWATPVALNGFLYGVFGQSSLSLRCIHLTDGSETWRQPGVGYGGTLVVSGQLLVSTDQGELALVQPDPAAYIEVDRFKAVSGRCWNVPALSDGRVFIRSTTEGAAYDLAPATLAKLKIGASLAAGGKFRLIIGTEDGLSLDAARAEKVDVVTASGLLGKSSIWTKLDPGPVLTNGQLQLEDAEVRTRPQRFFQVSERP